MTACPSCGAGTPADAAFCEACGAELTPGAAAAGAPSGAPTQVVAAAATPVTSTTGDESPLDVGWTGALPRATVTEPATPTEKCVIAAPGEAEHSPKSMFAVGDTEFPDTVHPPELRFTATRAYPVYAASLAFCTPASPGSPVCNAT